jgi:hypothetical protein
MKKVNYEFHENGEVWAHTSYTDSFGITSHDYFEVGTHSQEIYEYENRTVYHNDFGSAYILFFETPPAFNQTVAF